jgi:hypothetical protein
MTVTAKLVSVLDVANILTTCPRTLFSEGSQRVSTVREFDTSFSCHYWGSESLYRCRGLGEGNGRHRVSPKSLRRPGPDIGQGILAT